VLFASQIRWTDPATRASIAGIAILLAWSAITIWRWWQRQRVQEWPTTQGHIESATVGEKKIFGSSGGSSATFQAELTYSYNFEGEHYFGRYKEVVGSEAEGWEFVRDLKGEAVMVSYNPGKPAMSTLTQDAITALLSRRPPAGEGGFQVTVSDAPGWMKPLLWPMVALSVLGMALSLWVHLGAIVGKKVVPEPLFFTLQSGSFAVWFLALFVAQKRIGTRRKDFLKLVLRGSPDWLRFAVYGFSGYAVLIFVLLQLQTATGGSGTSNHSWYRTALFSAYWMGLCFSALAIFYSTAIASKQLVLKR
jgi:Protein of unknown function (DUF3592)